MATNSNDLPHIDAVSGQAAWTLAQILVLELVKSGVLSKETVRTGLEAALRHLQTSPSANPAQKASAVLLGQVHTLLQTADRRDSN